MCEISEIERDLNPDLVLLAKSGQLHLIEAKANGHMALFACQNKGVEYDRVSTNILE